jgi:hypothetical protein
MRATDRGRRLNVASLVNGATRILIAGVADCETMLVAP